MEHANRSNCILILLTRYEFVYFPPTEQLPQQPVYPQGLNRGTGYGRFFYSEAIPFLNIFEYEKT